MNSLSTTLRQIGDWWAYTLRCAQSPGCDMFWTWVWLAALAAVVFVGLPLLRKMLRNFLSDRAERMRLAERARVADAETLSRYRVDADKLYAVPEQEDVERRIRQALEERKAKDQWQRPGNTGGRSEEK
jgi:flagellar biosynthesis/type III secretory pathway M-ring protein FliF/YscJ